MSAFYDFNKLEKEWQDKWAKEKTFNAEKNSDKPKFYSLDMFPYPSGAGLHVGHPLGYIASDIVSRFKRAKGFNVLHPMGYDSFGLPAEQYAIQTGQHPEITTQENTARYREQLDKIGFSFEWDREVKTSSPEYYKWTQWIFLQLFDSWYNDDSDKAEPISKLLSTFEKEGNKTINAVSSQENIFTAEEWKAYSEKEQQQVLLNYRMTFLADTTVNWCPALGTVLANDEIKDGLSERGGHLVERKKMRQWSMRITAYAERLLQGLDNLDWTDSIKEIQRNWIGKSNGAQVFFKVLSFGEKMDNSDVFGKGLEVFTTRPDTIFGATYMTIAPEHEWVGELTSLEQKTEVEAYVKKANNRSERERMSDVKTISGVFTGSFAIHPFTKEKIQIWIGDYVLASYGTGAVMAVPAHDSRDYAFAKHFALPIVEVVGGGNIEDESYDAKEGILINSDFLNGLNVKKAIKLAIYEIEKRGFGKGQINYKMRDAVFSRQRYWGEPIPMYFKDGIPYPIEESELPLELPKVEKYLPTETGEPPLGNAENWRYKPSLNSSQREDSHPSRELEGADAFDYELSTMPGWAGSSWYLFRYMDSKNEKEFASKDKLDYWGNVDLYIGGAEHATGHLLYSRFWTKFLYDLGYLSVDEPFKKMINQGMIQGRSSFVYRLVKTDTIISYGVFINLLQYKQIKEELKENELGVDYDVLYQNNIYTEEDKTVFDYSTKILYTKIPVWIELVDKDDILDIERFKEWRPEYKKSKYLTQEIGLVCGSEVEKMSKSKYNVVNPDVVIERYGADTLRLYEMFLGPLEQFKPWSTQGIDGVHKFLKRFYKLFFNEKEEFFVSEEEPTKAELKTLHETIKKINWDVENYSFNTSVSQFMILLNELNKLKCNKRAILEPFVQILAPYAPHISEELWSRLGHSEGISYAKFPEHNEEYLKEDDFEYPIMISGKMRTKISFPIETSKEEIERYVLENEIVQKWLDGKAPKKMIVVPKKIVNVVV